MNKRSIKKILIIGFLVLFGFGSGIQLLDMLDFIELDGTHSEDPEEDSRFFRDVRTDAWSALIGDESGIIAVKEKLVAMYGDNAKRVKVDMANTEFSEGNWHYEFANLAESSIAKEDFFAATAYYSAAAFPHLYNDTRAHEMYDKALDSFKKALKKGNYPYKTIAVSIEGKTVEAYLVYPQDYVEGDSVPAIIETGGIDGLMTFMFNDYLSHWNKEGFAWIGFDVVGNGTSRNLKLTGTNADVVHYEVIKKIRLDKSIDNRNIFIYCRSLGAYAALRLLNTKKADELDVAGIVATCPPGRTLFGNLYLTWLFGAKEIDKNLWAARIKTDPKKFFKVIKASKGLALSKKNFWGDYVSSIPLMVLNTSSDDMSPVDEIKDAAKLSTKGSYTIIEDEQGHCPCRTTSREVVAQFVKENMR